MTIKLYKDSDNIFWLNNETVSSGDFKMIKHSDTEVSIVVVGVGASNKNYYNLQISDIQDEAGTAYSTFSDFKTNVGDFFVNASSGEGAITVEQNHYFSNTSTRDAYFVTNPSELLDGIYVYSDEDATLYKRFSGEWLDINPVIKGSRGEVGDSGSDGKSATIEIGTVSSTTTNASVTNSGTSSGAVFNFNLPRGEKGNTGATGASGINWTYTYDQYRTYAANDAVSYNDDVNSEYSGSYFCLTNDTLNDAPRNSSGILSSNWAVLSLYGEKGDIGDAATITIGTISTLNAGELATVSNSGDTSSVILDIGIPQGLTGETGDVGDSGIGTYPQFSEDNLNWHNTFSSDVDLYIRFVTVDSKGSEIYSDGCKFVGDDGEVNGILSITANDGIEIDHTDSLNLSIKASVATTNVIGSVKPDGNTITISEDGTISGSNSVDIATTKFVGTVKPDGDTITIDQDGTIEARTSVDIATEGKVGVVKPDGSTIIIDEDGTIKAPNSSIVEAFLEEVVTTNSIATITLSSNEPNLANATLIRSGNIVQFVWMDVIDLSDYAEGTEVFTFPEGFRPATQAEFVTTLLAGNEYGSCVFNIDTNGSVTIWGCTSSNEYYRVTGTYITTDSYNI